MGRNDRTLFQAMALMSGILAQLAGSVLIGLFTGKWLDGRAGTAPLFLLIGLFLGLAAGIYAMLRLVKQYYSGD